MESFWTAKKPIGGVRHFVLVNKTKEKGNIFFLMVSVVDSEINLKINFKELIKSGNWEKGWLDLSKTESITEEYANYKYLNRNKASKNVFVNDDSLFNIF